MKKRRFPICLLMFCLAICNITSCDINNKVNPDQDDEDESITDDTSVEYMTIEDSTNIALHLIANILYDNDTATVASYEEFSQQRKPDYGQLLYESTPSERYRIAQDFEDAKTRFITDFGCVLRFAGISTDSDIITISIGQKGKLTFSPQSGQGKLAVIDIDMDLFQDLTQIVFLSPQAWPNNDSDGGVKLGDTFKTSDGRRWVCVQSCAGGTEYGLLVTFDDNRNDITPYFDPACNGQQGMEGWHYSHYFNDRDWQSYVHGSGYAKSEELLILNRFLYDYNGKKNAMADKILSNEKFMPNSLYKNVFTDGAYYLCGDNSWMYWTPNKHKYKRYYYSQKGKKWKEADDKLNYIFMGNRWFVMHSNWMSSELKDDYWNSYSCYNGNSHVLNYKGEKINDENYYNSRNHDKKYDQKYVAVKVYRFHGDFGRINEQEGMVEYRDGYKPFILN